MTYALMAIILGFYVFLNIVAPLSGSATVTPLLAGLVGAKDAIAVASLFFFLVCVPRIYLFRRFIRWDIVARLWPISIVGAIIGGTVLVGLNELVVSIIVLGFLVYFMSEKIIRMARRSAKKKQPTRLGVSIVGLVSGVLQGTGLAGSDLRNGYLLSRGLSINALHGTTAIIGGSNFLFATIVRFIAGDLTVQMSLPILALFPVIVIATYLGRHVQTKLPLRWQEWLALVVMATALITLVISIFRMVG